MRYSRKKTKRHQKTELKYRVNEQITAPEVKLIDETGNFLGVVATEKALEQAREKELSLVEVSPKDTPPVAKIIDYGKLQYQKQKQERKQKLLQKKSETKIIKLSVRIGKHDIEFRLNKTKKFLEDKNKVKIELNLKGREKQHKDVARKIIEDFIEKIKEDENLNIIIEQPIKYKGNGFSAFLINNK